MEKMVDRNREKVVILGGGIAGLATAYFLGAAGIESTIFEGQDRPGGLSKSFDIDGFWFDYGAHASFTKDEEVKQLLENGVDIQKNVSSAINYSKGIWIKNPVQMNLFPLPTSEKIQIIIDMMNRSDGGNYCNYKEWLVAKYGRYFAEEFPCRYTRKYWTTDAENLETSWIGPRMYVPTLEEVLYGAFETATKSVHYSGEIRYPLEGGFGRFVDKFVNSSNIKCNYIVTKVNVSEKYVEFNTGEKLHYDYLVSTLPLDQTGEIFTPSSKEVVDACKKLSHTSMVLVSLGIKGKLDVPETFYVYDEDIMITRGFSTSKYGMKSAPKGHNTLQLEIYYSEFHPLTMSLEEIKQRVIDECAAMEIIKKDDIMVSDVRKVEYANVIFKPDIYDNKKILHNYLMDNVIYFAGRFADWDYMWVDQTIISVQKMTTKLIERIKRNGREFVKETN